MKTMATVQPKAASLQTPAANPLQRRCRCGKHTSPGLGCECGHHEALQQATSQPSTASAFRHDFTQIPVRSGLPARLAPGLAVSTPGDLHERQAVAMADRVMQMPDPGLSWRHLGQPGSSSHGGGNMDPQTRSFMQRRFGADFSGVRIHADASAARVSRELGAQAFTVGRDVYFAAGQYAPGSDRGRYLLAHELAHTIQQGHSRALQCPAAAQEEVTRLGNAPGGTSPLEREGAGPVEPMVQRSATWKGAAVHETVNSADLSFGGDAPVTWQQLNGTSLVTEADADSAVKVPTVTTTGAGANWKVKVDAVPAQEGSDDETVLSPGPWSKVVTKAAAGGVTGLAACAGPGNSTFSKHGKPSDDAVYKANRRHEDHHVADDKAAFEDAIGSWDKKVQEAKDKGTEFKGASAAAATAALWAAMGNTPQKAARSYRSQSFTKGDAFHQTAAGGPMISSNPQSSPDCSVSSLDVTNPG